jgi:phage terminase small subunit
MTARKNRVKLLSATELTGLRNYKDINFVIEYVKDFSKSRAAEAAGYSATYGANLVERPEIKAAIDRVLLDRLEASDIDAEWLLMEAVDNHMIARQRGKLAASNAALNIIAKHVFVDAYAAEKVEVTTDKEVMERLLRARQRVNKNKAQDLPPVSFL